MRVRSLYSAEIENTVSGLFLMVGVQTIRKRTSLKVHCLLPFCSNKNMLIILPFTLKMYHFTFFSDEYVLNKDIKTTNLQKCRCCSNLSLFYQRIKNIDKVEQYVEDVKVHQNFTLIQKIFHL